MPSANIGLELDAPQRSAGDDDTGLGVPSWFTGVRGAPEPAAAEQTGAMPWSGPDASAEIFGPAPAQPNPLSEPAKDDRPGRTPTPTTDTGADQPLRLPPAAGPWAPRRRAYKLGPSLPPSPQRGPTLVPPSADDDTAADTDPTSPPAPDGWPPERTPMHAAQSLLDFARPSRAAGAAMLSAQPTMDDAPAAVPHRATPAAAQPATDPDELAGQLYDGIRGRLRAELLIDRERAALLSDRH